MRELHLLRVGAPYIPGRRFWPPRVEYNFRSGSHEIRLMLDRVRARDVDSIRRGRASFGLAVVGPVIFLLYRFETAIPWSDCSYSIHLVPEGERQPPQPAQMVEPHALLQVILVDADTGLIRALRALTWSPAFTAAMHLAILEQYAAGFPGQVEYDEAIAVAYQLYPTSAQLLEIARVTTEAGA